jgi:hypothetical protein
MGRFQRDLTDLSNFSAFSFQLFSIRLRRRPAAPLMMEMNKKN